MLLRVLKRGVKMLPLSLSQLRVPSALRECPFHQNGKQVLIVNLRVKYLTAIMACVSLVTNVCEYIRLKYSLVSFSFSFSYQSAFQFHFTFLFNFMVLLILQIFFTCLLSVKERLTLYLTSIKLKFFPVFLLSFSYIFKNK